MKISALTDFHAPLLRIRGFSGILCIFLAVAGSVMNRITCTLCGEEPTALPEASADISSVEKIAAGLTFIPGTVNGALLERNGKILAVYGDPREASPRVDTVLFTHHRRDVIWAGRKLVEIGARAIVPGTEAALFSDPEKFWAEFLTKRFHDYAQGSTKISTRGIPVARKVGGADTIKWEGLVIEVLETPGFTRGALTYMIKIGKKKVAFTGDLIYGDGKLIDLYSLQDAIPEAGIRGYHGYAARLGQVVASLEKVAAARPDLIVPARGPLITDPQATIKTLLDRIRRFYTNYLSIDALRWYFKDDHIRAKARRVLGADTEVEWMPMAETVKETLPAWIIPIANSRLILAGDGTGFLVDCGGEHIIKKLLALEEEGKLAGIEHVFITHYHDDHTNEVSRLVRLSGATVHASQENRDVLENPGAHRLPAMTANPIHISGRTRSGARWRWKEFELAMHYFPGQTLHHDALLVRKDGGETIFFIGDSFTPGGIDDYCLLNRNFLHPGMGYFFCLDFLEKSAPGALLINQHVGPLFRYSGEQIRHMRRVLEKRVELLRPLVPWDDPNYALDEGWSRLYPYASQARAGTTLTLALRIMNHSPGERLFQARMRLPEGWRTRAMTPVPLRILPRHEGAIKITIELPTNATPGLHVITTDSTGAAWDLREWTEALIEVVR